MFRKHIITGAALAMCLVAIAPRGAVAATGSFSSATSTSAITASNTGTGPAVRGTTKKGTAAAIFTNQATTPGSGVTSTATSPGSTGVFGSSSAATGAGMGVRGRSPSNAGYGVFSDGHLGVAAGRNLRCTACVRGDAIGEGVVGPGHLADDVVGPAHIADGAVGSAHIADGSVGAADVSAAIALRSQVPALAQATGATLVSVVEGENAEESGARLVAAVESGDHEVVYVGPGFFQLTETLDIQGRTQVIGTGSRTNLSYQGSGAAVSILQGGLRDLTVSSGEVGVQTAQGGNAVQVDIRNVDIAATLTGVRVNAPGLVDLDRVEIEMSGPDTVRGIRVEDGTVILRDSLITTSGGSSNQTGIELVGATAALSMNGSDVSVNIGSGKGVRVTEGRFTSYLSTIAGQESVVVADASPVFAYTTLVGGMDRTGTGADTCMFSFEVTLSGVYRPVGANCRA